VHRGCDAKQKTQSEKQGGKSTHCLDTELYGVPF
jgi:hypothetical protein